GIAVRLDDGDDAPPAPAFTTTHHLPRGAQHGGDLHRVVALVVDDADAVRHPGRGEAPLDTAEAGQALADSLFGNAEFAGDGDGGRRVGDIVVAGHRQLDGLPGERLGALRGKDHVEPGAFRAEFDI